MYCSLPSGPLNKHRSREWKALSFRYCALFSFHEKEKGHSNHTSQKRQYVMLFPILRVKTTTEIQVNRWLIKKTKKVIFCSAKYPKGVTCTIYWRALFPEYLNYLLFNYEFLEELSKMYCGFALQIIDERSISCPWDEAAVGEFIIYQEKSLKRT